MLKIFKNLKKKDLLYLLFCAGLIVTQVWLDLTMPDYTAKLTTAISMGQLEMSEILRNGGMMLLCALGSMLAAIACGYFSSHIAGNFARTLRSKLFDKITAFSDAEINRFSTPSLITRTTNDVVQMQMLVAMGMQVMIKAPILAIWAITKISATSVEWTTATLLTVVVIVVTVAIVVSICYPRFKKIQQLTDQLNTVTRESISGVRVIRAFNADDYQQNKFGKVNQEVTKTHLFTSRVMGLMSPVITLCMSGLTLAIYWIGAILINRAPLFERAVVIGNMTAFIQYALQVVMAFMMLILIFVLLPRAAVSAKRINEVLDTEPSILYPETCAAPDKQGEIEFRNVAFSYSDKGGKDFLSNLNFSIHKGQTFAIIGATGSGKSTLINLIPRFYDVTGGQILLDGQPIQDYSHDELENRISIAPQRAVLFKGDVKSNVTYGSEAEIPDDDPWLLQSLQMAHADFVLEAENGLHLDVAQGGTNFSGGQKQRLSIARALFKKAEIVIFDDTFSALDYKTDMMVRRDIRQQLSDTTVILVAQRIGTIKNADQILVLDDGQIAGLGTHDELMQNCPVYQEIALSQLSKEEL